MEELGDELEEDLEGSSRDDEDELVEADEDSIDDDGGAVVYVFEDVEGVVEDELEASHEDDGSVAAAVCELEVSHDDDEGAAVLGTCDEDEYDVGDAEEV